MKFTISWLEKFLDLKNTGLDEIVKALTMLGLEVESVSLPSPLLDQFIVAEVMNTQKHPDADKLNVCSVNDRKNILQIICGAPNVRPGLKIVLAPIGSIIPTSNMKIERRKIRGVESEGMICSASELGIGEDSGKIIELDNNLQIGEKFVDQCAYVKDIVIDISVTPNRSDCLGVYGIARDLAAYGIGKLKPLPSIKTNKDEFRNPIEAIVEDRDACPLFVGRYFKGVNNLAQTPNWLKSALNAIGEKSISPIVDITNYINFSFARPLHAFDADKIEGILTVRLAKKGEKMLSLSDNEIELDKEDIVVADDKKVCALAGIKGGNNSKCDNETKNIFLESAVFDPIRIAKAGQRTKINSSTKYRFERGVDLHFALDGIEIATEMIKEICGGTASDVMIIGRPATEQIIIEFDLNLIEKLSGVVIENEKIKKILEKLGFEIQNSNEGKIKVTVPSWRHDVSTPEDLVEEVIRINGYDNITTIPIPVTNAINSVTIPQRQTSELQARSSLAALGFNELITWSFMSSNIAKDFGLLETSPVISNPISADLDILRGSLVPNLLSAIHKNNARSFNDLCFFEIGNVFENKNFLQSKMLCALRSGRSSEENIFKDSRAFDFFDIKSDALILLDSVFNITEEEISFASSKHIPSCYHPGKSAAISFDNKIIGYLGEIHPSIMKCMDISNATMALELLLEDLPIRTRTERKSLSDYQAVSRDFAFVVDKEIPSFDIIKSIKSIGEPIIKTIFIFDLFAGISIGEDKKSIAVRVTLQANDHSLSEKEINSMATKIITTVKTKINGVLRSN
jgi:phenylalanyl-tRNA synthetase beta chain